MDERRQQIARLQAELARLQAEEPPPHDLSFSQGMSQGSAFDADCLPDEAFLELDADALRAQASLQPQPPAPSQQQPPPSQQQPPPSQQPPAPYWAPPSQASVGPSCAPLHVAAPPSLQLDAEQRAVVQRDLQPGELLAVVAAAGAGKSTVLLEYARARPHLKTLYLTFAKPDEEEKKSRMKELRLGHVEVRTTHSLAYQPTKHFHRGQPSSKLFINWELLPVRTSNGRICRPKGSNVDAGKLVESLLHQRFLGMEFPLPEHR